MPLPSFVDGYVQVAVDSTGKKVQMVQAVDAAGNTVYVQVAQIVGEVPSRLANIESLMNDLLMVNRAILAHYQQLCNLEVSEDDFIQS